jgi:hypothetical protein
MSRIWMTSTSAEFFARYCADRTGEVFHEARPMMAKIDANRLGQGKDDFLFLLGLYTSIGQGWASRYLRMVKAFRRAVVMFAGTDIQQIDGHPDTPKLFQGLQAAGAVLVTESEEVRERIRQRFGLNTTVLYLPTGHVLDEDLHPMPGRFAVSCYQPVSRKGFYNHALVLQVAREMPDVPFHFYCKGGYGDPGPDEASVPNIIFHRDDIPLSRGAMQSFLSQISCGLRIVHHDTYSMSVVEHLMAGRYFVLNYRMPHCEVLDESFNDLEVPNIVATLREIAMRREPNRLGAAMYRSRHTPGVFLDHLRSLLHG